MLANDHGEEIMELAAEHEVVPMRKNLLLQNLDSRKVKCRALIFCSGSNVILIWVHNISCETKNSQNLLKRTTSDWSAGSHSLVCDFQQRILAATKGEMAKGSRVLSYQIERHQRSADNRVAQAEQAEKIVRGGRPTSSRGHSPDGS